METLSKHIGLVKVIAGNKKYAGRGLEYDERVSEGVIGLARAIKKYDPSKGKFGTYATWWIVQAIERALGQKTKSLRLPEHITFLVYKIKKASTLLTQQNQRKPKIKEIAEYLKEDPEKIEKVILANKETISIYTDNSEECYLIDVLEDRNAIDVDIQMDKDYLKHTVQKSLTGLKDKEKVVVVFHYGLDNEKAINLTKISKIIGCSPQYVQQIEQKALSKLRNNSYLKSYYQEVM